MFAPHLKRVIKNLKTGYENFLSQYNNLSAGNVVAAEIDYTIAIRTLNRAISGFKTEMRDCIKDYIRMKNAGKINEQYIASHVDSELKSLKEIHAEVIDTVPDDFLRSSLGKNYYFHTNLSKLTVAMLIEYFEMNYMILEEEK